MNRNFVNFRVVYDDLTDEVMRSSEGLKDHLRNWFEQIDETPAVGSLIQSLEAGLDLDRFIEEREATIQSMAGSGELRWPKGREQRLGMQLQLFRRISEEKLDAFDFSRNYMGSGVDVDDQIREFADQVFRPMARDLRRFLEERLAEASEAEVPASDRVVRLDHNSSKYKEAKEALETLEKLLQETNDYPDPEDKEQKIAEISAARRLLQAMRVRSKAIFAVVGVALLYLGSTVMTSGISTAAKLARRHILALLGVM